MRYFTSLADQSFKTAPGGERLFFPNGPWARPYVIPDTATEHRLYWKLVWMYRITLGVIIVGMPILFLSFPHVVDRPLYFLGLVVALAALNWTIGRLLFAGDVKALRRAETRPPLNVFFGDMGGFGKLVFAIVCCLLFVAGGIWMLMTGQSPVIAIFNIAFFGLCGAAWTYAFLLRRAKTASASNSR